MVSTLSTTRDWDAGRPTIWGLGPTQLHDRYWAARGVQVVRQGEPSEVVDDAELFLLTDARTLSLFRLARSVEVLSWLKPDLLIIRLHDAREREYREQVVSDDDGNFERFERLYGGLDSRLARAGLTPERRLAQLWQKGPSSAAGWRALRQEVGWSMRSTLSERGSVYDRSDDAEVAQFVRDLARKWRQPDATIGRIRHAGPNVIADITATVPGSSAFAGAIWVGAGRRLEPQQSIVGPAILWDDPAARPPVENLEWQEIEPTPSFTTPVRARQWTSLSRRLKRLFDIAFALAALAVTLPLYPLIMLAIWIEDGLPLFFVHQREGLGGREFGCIKFRTMAKNAEKLKADLASHNQSDGPQFHIDSDPRVTRTGQFLRKSNLDELPQFINVLLGHMSVVGPRPSPRRENQCCPAWREARLSVRPGITGLWQVQRTRRQGHDFQEWIKYDIEYVERASWRMDLRIILQTIHQLLRGFHRS
jgi:lipopolysaccharide/colanic/teichoic acid biosynthesis glycosyltransferase